MKECNRISKSEQQVVDFIKNSEDHPDSVDIIHGCHQNIFITEMAVISLQEKKIIKRVPNGIKYHYIIN